MERKQRYFDGSQKMSQWPKDIVNYLEQKADKQVYYGQSKFSKHEMYKVRFSDKKLFIGYNQDIKLFVAWNVKAHTMGVPEDETHIIFSLGEKMLDELKRTESTEINTFYKSVGKHKDYGEVFEKICVVPISLFEEFFENYVQYMSINENDKNFRRPAFILQTGEDETEIYW